MGIGTIQGPSDPGVPSQIGLPRDSFDINLDIFCIVVLWITGVVGRLCLSMCCMNMSLEEMLVTIGLVATFVRAREIAFVEVRDIVMGCKRLFLFNPRL